MLTKEQQERKAAVRAEMQAAEEVYNNFRYTDAQRERMVHLIDAAMKVMRGEADLNALMALYPQYRSGPSYSIYNGPSITAEHWFDTRVSPWTSVTLQVMPAAGDKMQNWEPESKVTKKEIAEAARQVQQWEPEKFFIQFSPPMDLQRERLEKLLGLKVVAGLLENGGNLARELPDPLHNLPPFDGGNFYYSLLNPPQADFEIKVHFVYLNGPDHNPYAATLLSRLYITRKYLSPEELRQRRDQKIGHLPQSGQLCPEDGRYLAIFADDELVDRVPYHKRLYTYGAGNRLAQLKVWNLKTRSEEWVHVGWQRVGDDPIRLADR